MHGGDGVWQVLASAMHGADDGDLQAPSPASHPELDQSSSFGWTRQQDKLLELLLCRRTYPGPRWDRIAAHIGDKTPDQACQRYESRVAELRRVLEAPRVRTPPEWDLQQAGALTSAAVGNKVLVTVGDAAPRIGGQEDVGAPAEVDGEGENADAPLVCMAGGEALERAAQHKRGRKRREESVEGRRNNRAVPWSPDEHKLFLAGIREHGTGKWQKLSREFVTTRNASQIASHYQKYTIRQAKLRRNEVKRPSIHDINDDKPGASDRGDEKPATAAGKEESGTTDDESLGEDEVAVGELF